jgi:hypothetical protein
LLELGPYRRCGPHAPQASIDLGYINFLKPLKGRRDPKQAGARQIQIRGRQPSQLARQRGVRGQAAGNILQEGGRRLPELGVGGVCGVEKLRERLIQLSGWLTLLRGRQRVEKC